MRRVIFEFRLNFWCENWGKFEREICFKIWVNFMYKTQRKKILQRTQDENYTQNFRVNLVSIWK